MQRIVSLIASATEIVHALEMGNCQVGRSHECDYPGSVTSLPVCTEAKFPVSGSSRDIDHSVKDTLRKALSVYDVHDEILERLQPTHIVTQSQCEVCAVSLRDVQMAVGNRLSCNPESISLSPDSIGDVWNDIGTVAGALDIPGKGQQLVDTLKQRMQAISKAVPLTTNPPRVACIEWIEPLMAAGNWMPELVELAGGTNLFGESGVHSGYLDWEQIVEGDPDVLVLLPCGFDMQRTEKEMYWLSDRPGWNGLRAVRNRRVYVTDGNQYFNRPGPRLAESLQILAEILHPVGLACEFQGVAWKQVA